MNAIISFLTPTKIKIAVVAGIKLCSALIQHIELTLASDYAGALAPILNQIGKAAHLIRDLLVVISGFVGAKHSKEIGFADGSATLDNAMRDLQRLLK
jgi:hypothetical protein